MFCCCYCCRSCFLTCKIFFSFLGKLAKNPFSCLPKAPKSGRNKRASRTEGREKSFSSSLSSSPSPPPCPRRSSASLDRQSQKRLQPFKTSSRNSAYRLEENVEKRMYPTSKARAKNLLFWKERERDRQSKKWRPPNTGLKRLLSRPHFFNFLPSSLASEARLATAPTFVGPSFRLPAPIAFPFFFFLFSSRGRPLPKEPRPQKNKRPTEKLTEGEDK